MKISANREIKRNALKINDTLLGVEKQWSQVIIMKERETQVIQNVIGNKDGTNNLETQASERRLKKENENKNDKEKRGFSGQESLLRAQVVIK
ncbi:hypothetical protein TNIN_154591 [Trichonephila inaurata madagascariensis]|uniref:Uncharacterized protein n=1 Tax=Trichonephila inaurata madagascariensis TaxID=2747483 RepID=A0A8X7CP83_9ARAC|nr:hypothetical protein TNIN_154591 [Trichonephila inaurata madagascariensis]